MKRFLRYALEHNRKIRTVFFQDGKMVQKTVKKERDYLKSGLRALGFRVWDSKANYIFFQGPEGLKEKLLERRVLIRSCGNYHGLDGTYYRICVKTREDNEKLLGVLEEEIG